MEIATKLCLKCQRLLPRTEFYKHKNGLSSSCKECAKTYNNQRYRDVLKHDPKYKKRVQETSNEWYLQNRERDLERKKKNHRQHREAAIAAYGGRCECCGESRYEFLALDHISGGGDAHRRQVGNKLARWLVRNNYPKDIGIRVLCHNCNSALGFYGYCPHQCEKS